jgi:dTDP-4-dehydrorhamnose 3,5-epimerase
VEGIAGLQVIPLQMEREVGGHVTELLKTNGSPASWRVVSCRAGTLRGMHAHVRGDGCRIVLEGRVALGLKDLRPGSASEGHAELLELSADEYSRVVIPAGVAHGLYAHTDALVLVALTAADEEEYRCAWSDPELGIEWPGVPLYLSENDRRAGSLDVLRAELAALLV